MSTRARVRLSTGETRSLGRLNVYRRALASWYGPGLFGNKLGCGGTLQAGSLGVANKSLPCGTKVTLRHHGRVLRVRGDRPRPVRRRARVRPHRRDRAQARLQRPRADPGHALDANVRASGATPTLERRGPEARHRPPRLRRVLRHRRADPAPRAEGQAGDRRRLRAALGRHHRLLRGAQVRRRLRDARLAGAAPVPDGDRHPARLHRLPREVARGVGARARQARPPAVDGARRGLRGPHRRREAAARAARADRRGARSRPGSRSRPASGPTA